MALVRWEPVRELHTLQQEMNRLFGSFFDSPSASTGGNGGTMRHWIPAMDLVETKQHFILRADLPGLSQEDVKIELEDDVLTISGERKAEHEEQREGYYRIERSSGRFARSLTLPEGVDANRIEATFRDGVLEVRVPKPEVRQPQRVKIGIGGAQEGAQDSDTIEGTAGQQSAVAGGEQPAMASGDPSQAPSA
jgi:HSP20 family protein